MNEWTTSPLEDLATFQKGRKVEVINQARNGFLPYLGAGVIAGRANSEFASIIGAVLASENDLLMLWDGERSGLVGTGKRGVVSSTVAKLTPKPKIDGRFLCYALFRYFDWIQARRTGTGVPHVPKDLAKILQVDHPADKSEQLRIANVLDTIDEAISTTEAVIAKLKQVRTGMLRDLLSYGLNEHSQLRDPIDHPEQFKDSPLGLIPREWETMTLRTLCNHIGSGVTPRGGQDVYSKEGILFIRSQNVRFEGLKLDDIAFISKHIHLGMLRSEVFTHDVLFNITGASIGRCCAMPDCLGQANVNQHVCILRVPEATEADALFLSTVLGSTIGQKQLDALNTCGNRQGLNYQQLGSFMVPWPKSGERHLIAQHVKKSATYLSKEIDEVKKICSLKSGLQDDLLTGQVRVPETIMEGAESL